MMLSLSHDQKDQSINPDTLRLRIVSSRDGGQRMRYPKDEGNGSGDNMLHNIENELSFNPKITIKPYYSKAEGLTVMGPQANRAQTGKPAKKRNTHAKSQRNNKVFNKDKIYRLPSLSKCLEHEILPKSSLMLKQICEIASSNTGFIKNHFEEYVKKKAKNLFASSANLHLGTAINPVTPKLQVNGREKERVCHQKDIGSYRPKQQVQVGITNFELTIDPQTNIINQPVVMPQATFTTSMRRPLSQQAEGDAGFNSSQNNGSTIGKLSTSPPKSQLMQYSPNMKENNRVSQQTLVSTTKIRQSKQILRFNVPNDNSRKNVFSSKPDMNVGNGGGGPIVKHYNGKSYIQDSKVVKRQSNTMVQTEHIKTEEDQNQEQHQHPLEISVALRASDPHFKTMVGNISMNLIPHLTKSASSSSSVDILSNHALQDLLQDKSFIGGNGGANGGLQSPKNPQMKEGMTAIEIKQYQFVGGVLTKTDPNQPMYLKSAYSTTNIHQDLQQQQQLQISSGQGKPNSRLGYTGSGRTLGQITLLKHQTPSSLMVSTYHLHNQQQHVASSHSYHRKRNAQYYSTAPTSGVVSPNRRYQQQPKKKDQVSSPPLQQQLQVTLKTSESSRKNLQDGSSNPVLPMNFLFKKSEEKETVKRANVFVQRQHPNTNDLAPVYDFEDAQRYYRQASNNSNGERLGINATGQPTSYYSMYDDKTTDQNNMTEMRNQSQLYQDRMRMAEHLKNSVVDSFQKNNVRTEMAYMSPDAIWGQQRPQLSSNVSPTAAPSHHSPASQNQHQQAVSRRTISPQIFQARVESQVLQEDGDLSRGGGAGGVFRESYIPQVIHLNAQVRLNTSYENQRHRGHMPSPQFQHVQQNQNRASPQQQNTKHKENFTIVLPPTNINQVSQNDLSTSFLLNSQTFAQGFGFDQTGKATATQTMINEPAVAITTRLNHMDSESELARENTLVQSAHVAVSISQKEQDEEEQVQSVIPENNYIVYQPMQEGGPILSVYQVEHQAKAQGFIKEMTFLAPANHDLSLQHKPLAVSKLKATRHRNHNKGMTTHNSTQGSVILGANTAETERHSPRAQPQRQVIMSQTTSSKKQNSPIIDEGQEQELVMFSESDEELAKKLMKQVLPSSYNKMVKKRRGDLSQINKSLAGSMDLTGRAQQKLMRSSFGIKNLDSREFSSRDKLKNSQYGDVHRGNDNLKLISMCIGTAPSQYKLDIPHMNSKIMQMFAYTTDTQDKGTAMTARQHIEVGNTQVTERINRDIDQIHSQLDVLQIQRVTLEDKNDNSTMKTPLTADYLVSPRIQNTRSNQDSWALQNQNKGKMLMINGQTAHVTNFPQTTKNQKNPSINKNTNVIKKTSSKLNLMQDSQDLRNQGSKFLNSQKVAAPVETLIAATVATVDLDQNVTPFKDANIIQLNGSELKNLCIKTTINITHHNPYAVNANKDLANIRGPPTPISNDNKQQTNAQQVQTTESIDMITLQQLQKTASQSSARFTQPLGAQLRQRRIIEFAFTSPQGAEADSIINSNQFIVQKNRIQQQQSHVKNILMLNNCDPFKANNGGQTVNIPNAIQNLQQSVSTVNNDKRKDDNSQLTYHHASNRSHMDVPNADITAQISQYQQDEKLGARFSTTNAQSLQN